MKTTAKRGFVVLILVFAVLGGMVFLGVKLALNGDSWTMLRANRHLIKDGSFTAAGNVSDRNGEVLAETVDGERVYNNSERVRKATLHIVGDSEGYISSGVQTAYKRELTGFSYITGIYSLKKYGRGNDVTLTIDSNVCAVALDKLSNRKGTVAVYNYKTGELICSVSTPTFDIRNKPSAETIEKNENGNYSGVYVNRLIDGLYTPGSTFKIITTASAVENKPDIASWKYTCTGETVIAGVKVTCPHSHGELDFKSAFAESCNCAYAHLAVEIGKESLDLTAKEFGFGKSFSFGNMLTKPSRIDLSKADKSDLAWAGVGQYTTLVNPYHMLTVVGAIANKGTAVLPYVVSEVRSPSGKITFKAVPESREYIDENTANLLCEMMRNNVESNYGDWNFNNLEMCGKTGTAEVSENEEPHAWFVGFSKKKDCPLAVIAVVENGGWGSSAALPIASAVINEAYKVVSG